ncbi:MAG TPA: glycosyl transferase family 2 [Lachnospiraceae bacterium]|nr:glycosyl transferase family 2 [Lachnospiraceae bacterium]
MTPMVSIIVPVYNVENYLRRCIESVLSQEYKNFELLLMDDGSRDGSGKICDSYTYDPRVKVVHKKNSGVSDTRNQAAAMARGKYLQFLDSDDWLTKNSTRTLVEAAEEKDCDMVIADYYRVWGERVSQKGDIETDEIMAPSDFAEYMVENPADYYYGVVWNKLFKREIIEKYGLKMDPEISFCEDFLFNLQYIRCCRRICAVNVPVYYYVRRKGSLVSQNTNIPNLVKMKTSVFEYYRKFFKDVLPEEQYQKLLPQIYLFYVDAAKDDIVVPGPVPGSYRLGQERIQAKRELMETDDPVGNAYAAGKIAERLISEVARKYDLSSEEVMILYYADTFSDPGPKKDIAELTGLSRTGMMRVLLNLKLKKMMDTAEYRSEENEETEATDIAGDKGKMIRLVLMEEAYPVVKDLRRGFEIIGETMFDGFSDEEIREYRNLHERVRRNMTRILA